MKKGGIPYYIRETNRYDDARIAKLIARLNASAVTVYDFLIEKAFKEEGCYLLINDDVVFGVAQALRLRESFVEEVISQCCNVGLFDKDVLANGGMIASSTMIDKYIQTCRLTHRVPRVPESLKNIWTIQQNVQTKPKMSRQNSKMSGQIAQMSGQNGVAQEKQKEFSPTPPIIEKQKEEHPKNAGANIRFVGEGDPSLFEEPIVEKPSEKSKETIAEKRERILTNLKKREQAFYDTLVPYVEVYGKEMIRAFFDYWTEPNKSGTQMRFEMEKTWSLDRRLNTWAKRTNQYERSTTSKTITATATGDSSRDSYAGISELIQQRII